LNEKRGEAIEGGGGRVLKKKMRAIKRGGRR